MSCKSVNKKTPDYARCVSKGGQSGLAAIEQSGNQVHICFFAMEGCECAKPVRLLRPGTLGEWPPVMAAGLWVLQCEIRKAIIIGGLGLNDGEPKNCVQ